jgi:uncharacterized protein (TIGR02246 family)
MLSFWSDTMDYIKAKYAKYEETPMVNEVIQAVADYNRALKSGKLSDVLNCFADDAVLIPEQQQPVVGKVAIQDVYASLFKLIRFNDDNIIHIVDAQASSDIGFVRSHETRGSVFEISSGNIRHPHFRELWIFKKDDDSKWKIAVYAYGIPSQMSSDPASAVVW